MRSVSVATGLVPTDEDEETFHDDRLVVEALPIDLGVAQHADQVIGRWLRPAVSDDSQLVVTKLNGGHHGCFHGLGVMGVGAAQHLVGPAQQVVVGLGWEPQHVGDEEQWQRGGDIHDEVALATFADAIHDRGAQSFDRLGVVPNPPGSETPAHQLAALGVGGVVHRDHHGHGQAMRAWGTCA
jgi:hypothetical protein